MEAFTNKYVRQVLTITAAQSPDASQEDADKALLMRIAKAGDVAAMEELYVRLRPRMVGFLSRMTQDEGLIEEAYNDVMIKVWDNAAQFEGRAKVSSWVFSIAYRTCLRLVKKQQKRSATLLLMGDDMPDVECEAQPVAEADQELAAAVTQLSPRHRLVVELCYFEGCSLEEISRIVGCPLNTVKTRLHHARKKLKQQLAAAS